MAKITKIWEWELKQYLRYEKRYQYKLPQDIVFDVEIVENKDITYKPIFNNQEDEKRLSANPINNIEIFESDDLKLLQTIEDPHAVLDPEFIQYTMPEFEKNGFTNCLFVIDEAHNFFGQGMAKELRRLLSYHRHYHGQDYLLISQDHKMFNFAVCQLASYSIRAINPIMRWRSDMFSYKIYSGGWISFSGDNKLESKTLKAKEVVFNLYNSGGKVIAKSHFAKIIMKLLAGILVLGIAGKVGLGNFTHQNEVEVVKSQKIIDVNTTKKNEIKKDDLLKSTEIFLIIGTTIIHQKTNKKFKFNTFERMLEEEDQPMAFDKNNDGTLKVYYELTKETINKLSIGGEKNEKNYNNSFNNM
ncbi:hypothetical protein KKG72_04725 [bacterium]|nr:hypothetical protein [bacterium]